MFQQAYARALRNLLLVRHRCEKRVATARRLTCTGHAGPLATRETHSFLQMLRNSAPSMFALNFGVSIESKSNSNQTKLRWQQQHQPTIVIVATRSGRTIVINFTFHSFYGQSRLESTIYFCFCQTLNFCVSNLYEFIRHRVWMFHLDVCPLC